MLTIKKNLEEYIKYSEDPNNFFYSTPKNTDQLEIDDVFFIPKFDATRWNTNCNKYWFYMMNKEISFPDQGWKIHITTTMEDSQNLLYSVADFLIKTDTSFKFVPNIKALLTRNGKYADRSEAGKFITIYPSSEKAFFLCLVI